MGKEIFSNLSEGTRQRAKTFISSPAEEIDSVRQYLEDISRYPLLTQNQELQLGKRVRRGQIAFEKLREIASDANVQEAGNTQKQYLDKNIKEGTFRYSPFQKNNVTARNLQIKLGLIKATTSQLIELSEDAKAASQHLQNSNLKLVVNIAKKYPNSNSTLMDIIQDGNNGLMKASAKFDYRIGFRFSTLATWWIRQTIQRGFENTGKTIREPVHVQLQKKRIIKSEDKQLVESGEINQEKTIQDTGIPAETLKMLKKTPDPKVLSLQTPLQNSEGIYELADSVLIADEDTEQAAIINTLKLEIAKILCSALTERQRKIINLRFGLIDNKPRTLDQAGILIGRLDKNGPVTRERIRQIESKALRKLRKALENHISL